VGARQLQSRSRTINPGSIRAAMLYRRNDIWYVKITAPDKTVTRRSSGTGDRQAAQEYHDRLKAQLWDKHRLGIKPSHSWDEAVVRWLQDRAGKSSIRDDRQRLRWFTEYLEDKPLSAITRDMVHELMTEKLTGVSDRTRDLYVALIRAIMNRAMKVWEWIDRVPAFRTYSVATSRRVRFLTHDQFDRLLVELPPHQQEIVRFAVSTGLRKSNILKLQRDEVFLDRKLVIIGGDKTKNKEPLAVPLNPTALAILQRQEDAYQARRRATNRPVHQFVFTFRGDPVKEVNTRAWTAGLRAIGVTDFRWHDLRHTWASWLRQGGVPTWALQEMGGWKSAEMVRRYAHVNADHLAVYADVLPQNLDVGHKKIHTRKMKRA
jgi:integrase